MLLGECNAPLLHYTNTQRVFIRSCNVLSLDHSPPYKPLDDSVLNCTYNSLPTPLPWSSMLIQLILPPYNCGLETNVNEAQIILDNDLAPC